MAGLDIALGADADRAPDRESWSATGSRYINREVSFLDFAARVLALAEDSTVPPLERAKFLAIVAEHLDEFFQVRVSGLTEQLAAGLRTGPDGVDLVDLLQEIRGRVSELAVAQAAVFAKELVPTLEEGGVGFVDWDDLSATDRAYLDELFTERIFPVLTPLAVDPAHPFPYISNLSLNLAVAVRDSATGEERFARVKVPPLLDRFLALPDGERFVLIEQLIAAKLDTLFPGMEVLAHSPFRVTRDTDFELEDEAEDLLEAVESVLRRRSRFGRSVRLEVDSRMNEGTVALLCRELELSEADVTHVEGPLDLSGLWALCALDRPDLKDEVWVPLTQAALAGGETPPDFFRVLQAGDVLVHHPYDSFTSSVEQFVEQAASDPHVLAIKQTIYRTAGPESALVARADQGRRAGQAGGRARRAHRPLRRTGEHRTCPGPRRGGRARRVRPRRVEDARQGAPRRAPGGRRHPPLLPHRHRQLQPEDRDELRGPRAADRRRRPRRRSHRPLQPPHRLQPPGLLPEAARRAVARPRRAGRTHRTRGREGRRRPHHDEDEQRSSTRA